MHLKFHHDDLCFAYGSKQTYKPALDRLRLTSPGFCGWVVNLAQAAANELGKNNDEPHVIEFHVFMDLIGFVVSVFWSRNNMQMPEVDERNWLTCQHAIENEENLYSDLMSRFDREQYPDLVYQIDFHLNQLAPLTRSYLMLALNVFIEDAIVQIELKDAQEDGCWAEPRLIVDDQDASFALGRSVIETDMLGMLAQSQPDFYRVVEHFNDEGLHEACEFGTDEFNRELDHLLDTGNHFLRGIWSAEHYRFPGLCDMVMASMHSRNATERDEFLILCDYFDHVESYRFLAEVRDRLDRLQPETRQAAVRMMRAVMVCWRAHVLS